MPTQDPLLYLDRDGAVATITLNRPERRNALSPDLGAALRAVLAEIGADAAVRAVVLTGAGEGFCSGADLTAFGEVPTPEAVARHLTERSLPTTEHLATMEKPVLAAVNGAAAGAGAAPALACDLRVMAEDAHLVVAFSNVGLVPDMGASWLLARQVGYGRAFEIAAEAKPVPAGRCLELGLANRVAPADALLDETHAWAEHLAQRPTRALGLTKRALYDALACSLPEAVRREAQLQEEAAATHDHREGVQAFLEKRPPAFTGR